MSSAPPASIPFHTLFHAMLVWSLPGFPVATSEAALARASLGPLRHAIDRAARLHGVADQDLSQASFIAAEAFLARHLGRVNIPVEAKRHIALVGDMLALVDASADAMRAAHAARRAKGKPVDTTRLDALASLAAALVTYRKDLGEEPSAEPGTEPVDDKDAAVADFARAVQEAQDEADAAREGLPASELGTPGTATPGVGMGLPNRSARRATAHPGAATRPAARLPRPHEAPAAVARTGSRSRGGEK
jgi:hypothetical protein